MSTFAAPGDTWGISGPDFLRIYLGALVIFILIAVLLRLINTRSGGMQPAGSLTAGQIAMLQGGPPLAVYSALAGLRAAGAVGAGEGKELSVTSAAPVGMPRLDYAVYDAASRRVRVSALTTDAAVRTALDELRAGLERSGLLLSADRRTRARLGGLLLWALAAFGLVRLIMGIVNGRPVGFLVALVVVALLAGVALRMVRPLSVAGKRALAQVRRTNAHLAPSQSPAWSTYGVTGAAMGVALFGTAALWSADPAFADEAGIARQSMGSSNGSYVGGGDSGSGSDSGSSSDSGGGGGGCGGGGCGG